VPPESGPLSANIELKARLPSFDAALDVARRLGAADQGEEKQVDTYFSTGRERLKLRESSTGAHFLIRYSRPDSPDVRKSQYRLQPVRDPSSFRQILTRQWGVRAVVKKVRHLFLLDRRVRIHLDRVEGLGDFLEFEAVLDPGDPEYDEAAATLEVARLAHDFGVADEDRIATSYSTLVLEAHGSPSGT
jgi:predicted adenylyl cyclase CyaB